MTTKNLPAMTGEVMTGGKAGGRLAEISTPSIHHKRPNRQAANELLAYALRYALAGWRVLPLVPNGKAPAIPAAHPEGDPLRGKCKGECGRPGHGVHDASADPETIGAWWQRWPAANIGLALDNAHVVLDVDPRHGGRLEDVYKLGVDVDRTPVQRSWSGGWHVLLEKPVRTFGGKVPGVPGVDVLSGDRYIVAAPSVIDGKPYRWERDPLDVDPVRIPLELAERLTKRSAAARTDGPNGPTAAQPGPRGNVPPFHVLEHALAHLDPWAGGYDWWLSILMAIHSGYPGPDGLALAEAWADGKPGEVAGKWATFDAAGGVTVATLLHHAKQAGWRPELAQPDAPTRETAHSILHKELGQHGGDCPICGKSFFQSAVVGDAVHLRRRVMACHKRDCMTWQQWRIENKLLSVQPWTWAAWFVVEVPDGPDWRRMVNGGQLGERADWIAAPTVKDTIALFAGWQLPGSVSVSLATMLGMAAERMLAIPDGRRLRKPKDAARAKRAAPTVDAQPVPVAEPEPAQPVIWTRNTFGLDLLNERETWEVLAILENHGATVDRRGNASYPLALDGTMRAAVARWIRPERTETDLSAYTPTAGNHASISGSVPLPDQPAYAKMTGGQRQYARLTVHADTNKAAIAREVARM